MSRQKEKKYWGASCDIKDIIRVYNIFRFPKEPILFISCFNKTKSGSIARRCSNLGMIPEVPGKGAQKGKGIP
jgi:hypothetical protein